MSQNTNLSPYCQYFQRSLKRFLNDNIFHKYQSGFKRNYSTDLFLSFLSDNILKGFSSGIYTGMILSDLQ